MKKQLGKETKDRAKELSRLKGFETAGERVDYTHIGKIFLSLCGFIKNGYTPLEVFLGLSHTMEWCKELEDKVFQRSQKATKD